MDRVSFEISGSVRWAMKQALYIQERFGYPISGSLSLIFNGLLDPRTIHDIDMCRKEDIRIVEHLQGTHQTKLQPDSCKFLWKHSFTTKQKMFHEQFAGYIEYDIFHMAKDYEFVELCGIKFHDPKVIIKAKRDIGRTKDVIDLKQIDERVLANPFPYHLLPDFHPLHKH